MKRFISIFIILFSCYNVIAQGCKATISDMVLIPKTIVLPQVKTGNIAVDNQMTKFLNYEFVTHETVAQLKQDVAAQRGIVETKYVVNYNTDCIVSITITTTKSGAYIWESDSSYNFNLKSGKPLTTFDIFTTAGKVALTEKCDSMLQITVNQLKAKYNDDDIRYMLSKMSFGIKNLNEFKVMPADKDIPAGIVFKYSFGFPSSFGLDEDYCDLRISFNELKKFIRMEGSLGFVLVKY